MDNIKTFEGFWDFLKDKGTKVLHHSELFALKQKIKMTCDKLKIENYTINNDGTIDVNGDVHITMYGDKKSVKNFKNGKSEILIHFNKVNGDVDVDLNGNIKDGQMPFTFNEVTGNFFANHNKLETLKGCPKIVGGDFDVRVNILNTLEGAPKTVGRDFFASNNLLGDLKYSPEYVGGNFDVSDNSIDSLEGMSKTIRGTLDISRNRIRTFDHFTDCKITSDELDGNPVYLIFYILFQHNVMADDDLSQIIDLFKSYDPIHPSKQTYSILYLDRLEGFVSEVLGKDINLKEEIEKIKVRNTLNYPDNGESLRFALEGYYNIKY